MNDAGRPAKSEPTSMSLRPACDRKANGYVPANVVGKVKERRNVKNDGRGWMAGSKARSAIQAPVTRRRKTNNAAEARGASDAESPRLGNGACPATKYHCWTGGQDSRARMAVGEIAPAAGMGFS